MSQEREDRVVALLEEIRDGQAALLAEYREIRKLNAEIKDKNSRFAERIFGQGEASGSKVDSAISMQRTALRIQKFAIGVVVFLVLLLILVFGASSFFAYRR